MNFLIALSAHALVGAAIGAQSGQPVIGLAAACGAFFATTLLWLVLPSGEDEC